ALNPCRSAAAAGANRRGARCLSARARARARRRRAAAAGAAARRARGVTGAVEVRIPSRAPLDGASLLAFFAARAVPGVENVQAATYRRSLRLPKGAGVVELMPTATHVDARLWLDDNGDLPEATRRSRSMLDLDRDPRPVLAALGADDLIGPLIRAAPGLRVPGTPDPHELAIRAVIGQQISVAG